MEVRPVAPWRPSEPSRVTRPEARPKRRVPSHLEVIRTGAELLSVSTTVAGSGLLGAPAAAAGGAMGSLSSMTLAVGMVQVMSGLSTGDKRHLVCGGLDLALGATGLGTSILGLGAGSHPMLGVVAVALFAARVGYTVKNGSPI